MRHHPLQQRPPENEGAEVRGVGRVTKVSVVAGGVVLNPGREDHHPGEKVLKTGQVRHASSMLVPVQSLKMTLGKSPKAEMLSLDIISTPKRLLFDPTCTKWPLPVRLLPDTRRTLFDQNCDDNSCIKDNWSTYGEHDDGNEKWTGKTISRLKQRHQVAMMSVQRKKVFKVSCDKHVKAKTFRVDTDMVKHQHIKQSMAMQVHVILEVKIARSLVNPTMSNPLCQVFERHDCYARLFEPNVVSAAIISL